MTSSAKSAFDIPYRPILENLPFPVFSRNKAPPAPPPVGIQWPPQSHVGISAFCICITKLALTGIVYCVSFALAAASSQRHSFRVGGADEGGMGRFYLSSLFSFFFLKSFAERSRSPARWERVFVTISKDGKRRRGGGKHRAWQQTMQTCRIPKDL